MRTGSWIKDNKDKDSMTPTYTNFDSCNKDSTNKFDEIEMVLGSNSTYFGFSNQMAPSWDGINSFDKLSCLRVVKLLDWVEITVNDLTTRNKYILGTYFIDLFLNHHTTNIDYLLDVWD